MKNQYRAIQGSLLRHCVTASNQLEAAGFGPFSVINLDAFTDEKSWPEANFVGLAEFHLTMDDTYEGSVAIVLGLVEDTNLLQSAELIEVLLEDLLPNSSLPVLSISTAEEIGKLLIKGGVTVSPPYPSKTRPLLPIMFSFTSNLQTG